jgi:diguanylate cyclase (GGDEF)-like protein/PAS domain S-box-containing protein
MLRRLRVERNTPRAVHPVDCAPGMKTRVMPHQRRAVLAEAPADVGTTGSSALDVYRLALRVNPQPVSLSRLRDGVLIDVSDSYCQLAGLERSRLIGRKVGDIGLWVDLMQRDALLQAVQAAGAVQNFEVQLRSSTGEIRTLLIGATRVDAQPEALLLCVGLDITTRVQAEQTLADSEHRYRQFIEAMPLGVLITQNGNMMFANPKIVEMSGYSRDELEGRSFAPMIHEDDRARVAEVHAHRMAGEVGVSTYDIRVWRRDGALRHWQARVQTIAWAGLPSGLSILSDITEQVQSEIRLRELSSIVEQTSDAIMLTAVDGCIQYVNPGFERLTGYSRDEVLGKTPAALKSGAHEPQFYRQLWETISAGRSFHSQVVNRRKDGTLYHAVKSITPMLDTAGRIVSYVNIDKDFTVEHEAQRRTAHLALHDNLTGLPNRALLMERLSQAIARHARDGQAFSLLFIDLDGFKAINDCLGHQVGDEVLQQVALRLSQRMRGVDTVARIGGDEFVVLLTGVAESAVAAQVATELITAIGGPMQLPSGVCQVGASIGISVFPRDGDTMDTILQSADSAMYAAKRAGRNGYRIAGEHGPNQIPTQAARFS